MQFKTFRFRFIGLFKLVDLHQTLEEPTGRVISDIRAYFLRSHEKLDSVNASMKTVW